MTIGSVVLAFDKTHLTNHRGDKHIHTIYLILGNILKEVHFKLGHNIYMVLAYIPMAKWEKTIHLSATSKVEALCET